MPPRSASSGSARPAAARTKPAPERRHDLLAAAERLFLEKGVDRTTVEDITAGAGVAKGTFYLHFASKPAVLDALRARLEADLVSAVVTAVEARPEEDRAGRLAAWATACCRAYLEAARLHHLVFVAAPPPTREGLARNGLIEHLSGLLEAGTRHGAWTVEDPQFTAVFLFNALHGAVHQPDAAEHRETLSRAVADHFRRCVGPASAATAG